jgi:hypothetical protein
LIELAHLPFDPGLALTIQLALTQVGVIPFSTLFFLKFIGLRKLLTIWLMSLVIMSSYLIS